MIDPVVDLGVGAGAGRPGGPRRRPLVSRRPLRAARRTTGASAGRGLRRPGPRPGRRTAARRPRAGIRCRTRGLRRGDGRGWASATSDTVIGYDDAGGVMAARLVWMLRATGHEAALLDGGLDRVRRRAGDRDEPDRPPAAFTAAAVAGRPAGRASTTRPAGSFVVLDARRPGAVPRRDRADRSAAGHIPGARSLPCRENLDADGRFLPVAELRERFAAVGVHDGARRWSPTAAPA